MRLTLISVSLFALLGSCAPAVLSIEAREACFAAGGAVRSDDDGQICLPPYEDAGQSCARADDCAGTCQRRSGATGGQCMAHPLLDTCGLEYFDGDGTLQFGVCI